MATLSSKEVLAALQARDARGAEAEEWVRVEQQRDEIKVLNVRFIMLTALPEAIGDLRALETLVAYGNALTALPASLCRLQALKVLDLYGCKGLTSLPSELGGLQALTVLNLERCEGLTSLPPELGRLQALTHLNLDRCSGLTSLPDLSGLEKLEVKFLPEKLKPWKEGGRKAFALG